jgi:hypothetical protein
VVDPVPLHFGSYPGVQITQELSKSNINKKKHPKQTGVIQEQYKQKKRTLSDFCFAKSLL